MEDQTTEQVGNTYEDRLEQDRKGIDISMPDVEVVSKEPQQQEAVDNDQKDYRVPSEITAEGNQEEVNYATDWEQETRKFQSMYDKQKAEFDALNSQVQPLQQLQSVLESRPDVVESLQRQLEGKPTKNNESKSQENIVDENSFDPWEAYYKPESPSYKLRVGKEKA